MESGHIIADAVEVSEFPHLAQKYKVMGVPKTVINEEHFIEGAGPEAMLMGKILEAINSPSLPEGQEVGPVRRTGPTLG